MTTFYNNTSGIVTSGGTTAPSPGTTENWTVSITSGLPVSFTSSFHVADPALPSEKILVTGISGSGPSYTYAVTRGDESTTPVAHTAGFAIQQVVTAGEFSSLVANGTVRLMPLPSGDATGVTDTAAFRALLAALPTITVWANPISKTGATATYPVGTILLQATPGAYNNPIGTGLVGTPYYFGTANSTSGDFGNTGPFVSVLGPGSAQCRVCYLGTGDQLRSYSAVKPSDDGLGTMNAYGNRIDGFTLDGSQATGSHPCGLHIGDQDAVKLGDDLHIEHFTSGQLSPPVLVKGTTGSSGGTFAAGTYFWRVTALNAAGQETGTWRTATYNSQGEITATLVLNGTQAMSWAAIPNAVSYNVYRGTVSGSYTTLVANTASTSYTDTGATGTVQSPPNETLAGGKGLWIDNTVAWSEAFQGRVVLRNNSQNVTITGADGGDASTEYNDLSFKIYAMQYQNGVVLNNGAWYQHGEMKVKMNMAKSPNVPFGTAALTITGRVISGVYSQFTGCRLDIQAETNTTTVNGGGTNAPMTISFGDSNNNWIAGCVGVLSFAFGTDWKTSNWQGSLRNTFQFLGTISGDTVLNPAGIDFHPAYAGALLLSQGQASGGAAYGNTGDTFAFTLSANTTITMTQNSGAPQRKTFWVFQPSSGGTYNYTASWPSTGSPNLNSPNIVWDGGNAPIMPTGISAWLRAELATLDGITWYGAYTDSNGYRSSSLVVQVPSSYANGTFSGPGDGTQFANFNLADNTLPLDQNPGGHYWAFSHRADAPAHRLMIFNYNGAGTYTNVLQITEGGQITSLHNTLDDGFGDLSIGAKLNLGAGTTSYAPLNFQSGSLLTTPVAGTEEYDGALMYATGETTSGRGLVSVEQKFRLTATGSTISTIANYFGTTSNISLVSGAEYEIEIVCWFLKTTSGTVTWTFTNSAAPTSMTIDYQMSPATGIVSTPAATDLFGQQYNVTTTAPTVVSPTLTTAVNHRHRFWIRLINSTGTSLQIQATAGAGTITPGINSYWIARRVPAANVGHFAA